jgi:hypothetical protein
MQVLLSAEHQHTAELVYVSLECLPMSVAGNSIFLQALNVTILMCISVVLPTVAIKGLKPPSPSCCLDAAEMPLSAASAAP